MEVMSPVSLSDALASLKSTALSLIPWEKESSVSIKEAFRGFQGDAANIFIGPEGGWDGYEIERSLLAGVKSVKLGPTLLRTETAGLVSATLVLREFGLY
jgi:16S rRNA (uracil1498-N3)-methyltransferase